MKKYVVYTALFGDYDQLRELPFEKNDCDYICFTDQNIESKTWKIIKIDCDEDNFILMNRKLKMLPHVYLADYDASLYIDSNIEITSNVFPLFNKYLKTYFIAFPEHFARKCIYDEIKECISLNKISHAEGMSWFNFLESKQFPKQYGLSENNIILRKHTQPFIIQLMELWWEIFQENIKRDQLSLIYLIWKLNISFIFMQENSRNNNVYFKYYLHKTDKKLSFLRRKLAYISARRYRNRSYLICYNLIELLKKCQRNNIK